MKKEEKAIYMKEYLFKYRLKNRQKILKQMRDYGRKYRAENREKKRQESFRYYRENKEAKASYLRKYREENPAKNKARQLVASAIRSGRLIKQNCWCGGRGQAHHDDYARPLEVKWLCQKHHMELHRKYD